MEHFDTQTQQVTDIRGRRFNIGMEVRDPSCKIHGTLVGIGRVQDPARPDLTGTLYGKIINYADGDIRHTYITDLVDPPYIPDPHRPPSEPSPDHYGDY